MKRSDLRPLAWWLLGCSAVLAGCGDDTSGDAGSGGATSSTAGPSSSTGAGAAGGGGASSTGAGASGGGGSTGTAGAGGGSAMNVFVSSDTSPTADLGGLDGADKRCQALADAAGAGAKTWHAYLSAENPNTNARDRIGSGPYYNALGAMLAADKDALHGIDGNADLFLTEKGEKVNGQWPNSPDPNEHDILTGSTVDGMVSMGDTCGDWTATTGSSQVGHSDGLGPSGSSDPQYRPWSSVHTGQCGDTAPGGGAGRIYCFASD